MPFALPDGRLTLGSTSAASNRAIVVLPEPEAPEIQNARPVKPRWRSRSIWANRLGRPTTSAQVFGRYSSCKQVIGLSSTGLRVPGA